MFGRRGWRGTVYSTVQYSTVPCTVQRGGVVVLYGVVLYRRTIGGVGGSFGCNGCDSCNSERRDGGRGVRRRVKRRVRVAESGGVRTAAPGTPWAVPSHITPEAAQAGAVRYGGGAAAPAAAGHVQYSVPSRHTPLGPVPYRWYSPVQRLQRGTVCCTVQYRSAGAHGRCISPPRARAQNTARGAGTGAPPPRYLRESRGGASARVTRRPA